MLLTTLALTMEARMDRDSATLALLLPYSAIAPVAHRFSSRDDVGGGVTGQCATRRGQNVQVQVGDQGLARQVHSDDALRIGAHLQGGTGGVPCRPSARCGP